MQLDLDEREVHLLIRALEQARRAAQFLSAECERGVGAQAAAASHREDAAHLAQRIAYLRTVREAN